MKDLETVLKSYEIHVDRSADCRECAYKRDQRCLLSMNDDLYNNLKALKEENRDLKELNNVLIKHIEGLEFERYR